MKETTNYKLKKIELTDSPPDITVHSGNFDIIDTEMKRIDDEATNVGTGLADLRQEVNAHLADYASFKTDYEYQIATVIDRQIRLQTKSDTNILKFRLNEDIPEGEPITISLDGGVASKPLLDFNGEGITELEKGFVEVINDGVNFTLRPRGASLKYCNGVIAESISYGGTLMALAYDDVYIYVGGKGNNTVWKLRKTDLMKIRESMPYGGTVNAIAVDENYLYIYGEGESTTLWKVNKLNMVKVAEVAANPRNFFDIIQDTDYIYEIESGSRVVYKVRKSDMTKVKSKYFDNSPLALAQDESYLYVGCNSRTVFKLNKSDMQVVAESSGIGYSPSTIIADNNYIYAGGSNVTAYGTITKIRKTDMVNITESVRYLSEPRSLSQDDNYIYWGSDHSMNKIRKSDLGKVTEAWNTKASMLICDGLNVYANSGVSYLTVQKLDKWLTNHYIYKDQILKPLEV